MLSSRGCPPSRASFSIVANPLQSLKDLHAPPSDISVSCRLGSGSQTSSYQPRLSLVPVHQVCRPVVFWAARREAWPVFGQVSQKRRERLPRRCWCECFVLLGSEEVCRVSADERGQRALNGAESVKICEAAGAAIKRVRALEAAGAERSSKRDEYGAGSGAG